MFLVKIIINDCLLLFMKKKASDKYSNGSCRSSCCDVIIYKILKSKTMESIKSE